MNQKIPEISDVRAGEIARLVFQRDLVAAAEQAKYRNLFNEQPFDPQSYRRRAEKIASDLNLPLEEYFAFIIKEVTACGFPKYANKLALAAALEEVEK